MKRIMAILLVCLLAFSLCGCEVKCTYEGCDKKTEMDSEHKSLLGSGYLCEEHLEEQNELLSRIEDAE